MEQVDTRTSPKRGAAFFFGAAVMLALWGASLIPAIKGWNGPREDGFSFVPAFWATITFLPFGLTMLIGGLALLALIVAF